MARHIDADRLLSFIQHDLEIISPCEHTADDIVMMIQTAPPSDVEPVRHGRWIPSDMGGGQEDEAYVCSVCDDPWVLISGTPQENNMNYCHNCGAKMDLEEENAPAD